MSNSVAQKIEQLIQEGNELENEVFLERWEKRTKILLTELIDADVSERFWEIKGEPWDRLSEKIAFLEVLAIRSQKVQVAKDIKKGIKPQANQKKEKVGSTMEASLSSKNIWDEIQEGYDISKRGFGKKFNFVTDQFKRKIIFRDVEHAHILANNGFSKPAVILAGGVIEELLRLYLDHKRIKPANKTFDSYIKTCENNGLLKSAISRLTDSVRHFRNIVHLRMEDSSRITISKATAKGAVASIFTLANDF